MSMVMVMVMVPMGMLVGVNVEFDSFDTRFVLARCVQMKVAQPELRKLPLQIREGHPQINQRADKHVAADSAENIQVQCFHFSAASVLIWLAA
jgi:hypothetical protein